MPVNTVPTWVWKRLRLWLVGDGERGEVICREISSKKVKAEVSQEVLAQKGWKRCGFRQQSLSEQGRTSWWVVREWRPMWILGVGMCSHYWASIFQSIQYLKDIFSLCIKIHFFDWFLLFIPFFLSLPPSFFLPSHPTLSFIFFLFFLFKFFPVLWNPIYLLNSPSQHSGSFSLFMPQAFSQQFILLSATTETWLHKNHIRVRVSLHPEE